MSGSVELTYDDLPSVAPLYARAATKFRNHLSAGGALPPIAAHVSNVAAQQVKLARYREVCAFPRTGHLPVTYPHVLAFPLHMAVMTHKSFPLKLLGLVHVRNDITQYRSISNDEALSLTVRVGDQRRARRGLEFDLVTEFRDGHDHLVWSEVGTMLSRRKGGVAKRHGKKAPEGPPMDDACIAHWDIASNIGRRYAVAAGDFNPIHLGSCSARLFGFRRAIATGMWLKARVAAELAPRLYSPAYKLSVAFKKPVFLPSPVSLASSFDDDGAVFALTNPDGDVMHLQGRVSYL